MEIHQPHRMMVTRKVGYGCKPALDLGAGISLRTHFLESSSPIQMQDWKSPKIAGFAFPVSITLRRPHSGIASEVVRDKTVGLQPVRNPWWLIAIRSGIFGDRLSSNSFQRILVERQKLFEVFRIVGFDVSGKVIVNPSAMAAN